MSEKLRAEVLARVAEIIRQRLGKPDLAIAASSTARDLPGWDSLAHVGILVAVEKAFQFRIRSTEMARLADVGSLVDLVLARGKP